MKIKNPFVLKTYAGPKYFCNRQVETNRLVNAALNGQTITLFALRKFGKSGLIDHVGNTLVQEHNYAYIYTDLFHVDSTEAIANTLIGNVITQLFPQKSWLSKVKSLFNSLQAHISLDEFNGNPQISLGFNSQVEVFNSLEQIMLFVNNFNKPVYWAMDEFQQINELKNGEKILKIMRSMAQRCTNIHFIFSGSHTQMLLSIFENTKAPFYKSTQLVPLHEIAIEHYKPFIINHFKEANKTITDTAVDYILTLTMRHTWYVQATCNRLFQQYKKVDIPEVKLIMAEILQENEIYFLRLRQLLTPGQWRLIKAIGKTELVQQPTAAQFLNRYSLGTSATVLRGLNKLLDDEIVVEIYQEDTKFYRLNDVFLIRWIQWKYYNF